MNKSSNTYVAPGMPPLDMVGKSTSFFEFWPTWLMYCPVVLLWLGLSIRHRSLSLPLLANPCITLSGMVGLAKSALLAQASDEAQAWILPWFSHTLTSSPLSEQLADIEQQMQQQHLDYPIVVKPEVGCRGSGVKLINNRQQLEVCLQHYPKGSACLVQKLSDWEPEVGIFYVRPPRHAMGAIISMAFKYSPYVVGDGAKTLRQLLSLDPRAQALQHLYTTRHQAQLDTVIPRDHPYRLVFSASHCRGAIFRDGRQYITPQLTDRIDQIIKGIPDFYYGRLDVKFATLEALQRGEQLAIVEINGASSESLHIWDRQTTLRHAAKTLIQQYRWLFQLGAHHRKRGLRPPGILALLRAWRTEYRLVQHYPETD